MSRVLYLHGFASGPSSRKATFFKEELERQGLHLEIPDLAEGDFRGLTITGQLNLMEREIRGDKLALIGSSLGGYLAALYSARHPEIVGMILLAPAFNLCQRWQSELGPEKLHEWQQTGEMPVYHYAEKRTTALGFQFMKDAEGYEAFPDFRQSCLIFHGTQDPVVPVDYSEWFAADHGNAKLIRLQSGHELTDVLGLIWEKAGPFLLRVAGR
jgi:uncharacterized protein